MKSVSLIKISMEQRIAIFFVVAHLFFVIFAFYQDSKIFSDPGASCRMQSSGQVETPFPLLIFSDIYYIVPAAIFDSLTGGNQGFIRAFGTGGPCTYISLNPVFPYSLIFIFISSLVYYWIGLMAGRLIRKIISYFKK